MYRLLSKALICVLLILSLLLSACNSTGDISSAPESSFASEQSVSEPKQDSGEENKTSHFNPLKDSVIIYVQILKYIASSLSATVIDLAAFALFFSLLFSGVINNRELCTAVCSVMARIISSLCNYYINFRFVFAKKATAKNSLLKYYLLVAGVMVASSVSTSLLTLALPRGAAVGLITLVKAAVDTVLFLVTFTLQREWVFGGNKKK